MKKIDRDGLTLCRVQGNLFERSIERFQSGSLIFIRRFMNSKIAGELDSKAFLDDTKTVPDVFDCLESEYGSITYGHTKYSPDPLYWIGYIYRYFSYTYELSSKQVYKIVKPKELYDLYLPYHTMDCSFAIERILEEKNIHFDEESINRRGLDIYRRLKAAERKAGEKSENRFDKKLDGYPVSAAEPETEYGGGPADIKTETALFVRHLAAHLSDDILERLKSMAANETHPAAKKVYECMLEDLRLADELKRPLCQDTGIVQFYVKIGAKRHVPENLREELIKACELATKETPLRPNAVEPLTGKNTGCNTGTGAPFIDWEIVPGDCLEITVYLAGGGSSLPGFATVLTPGEGIDAAKILIIDTVKNKGANACPPLLAGVGIASAADVAAKLSKKALLRPLNEKAEDPKDAELEKELFDELNALRLGPSGMGGDESVIGVNVISNVRHPATFAVALSTGCWATRRGTLVFAKNGRVSSPDFKDYK